MEQKTKNNFMVQGAILGISSIVVRLIGVVYRIPLTNIIGDKGIGYYSVAFDIYSILLLLSSYSMPLAVSKMVSSRVAVGEVKNTRKILLCALALALLLGICAFSITFFLSDIFASQVMQVPQSAVALRVLSFALIILSILGVIRGYFQGLGNMIPTALSNIIEQIFNAVISVVAAGSLYEYGKTIVSGSYDYSNLPEAFGAAGGTLGTVCGALAAMIFLIIVLFLHGKKNRYLFDEDETVKTESLKIIIKVLILTIVPVILNTAIYNLSSVVDKFIFSNIATANGMDADLKDSLIGMFSGKYWLIVNIPIALASALASSLIPSIVSSVSRGEVRSVIEKVRSAIRITLLVSLPCAAGIAALAEPIVMFLFPSSEDPEKVALMLITGCLTVVFYCISTISNSILQGIDKMRIPVIHSAVSLAINALVLCVLMAVFNMDVFAWIIADMVFALSMCIMNALSLKKYLGYKQEIKKTFLLPGAAAVIMGAAAYYFNILVNKFIHHSWNVIISIIVAVVIYGILLLLFRAVDSDVLRTVPGGTRLCVILKKMHLLK